MGAYLHVKFGVCSIILTNFRQEGGVIPPPTPPPQNELLKSPPRLGLNSFKYQLTINVDKKL